MNNTTKTIYICSKCDAQFPKWSGRCLECGSWGTIEESTNNQNNNNQKTKSQTKFNEKNFIDLNTVKSDQFQRIKTNINEVDNIFGGGIVMGSLTLIGGEPGIGKSTLVLQILNQLDNNNNSLLYISGEESAQQIKLRMERLQYNSKNLKFLSETNVETIISAIATAKPQLAIIDSIQTIHSNEVETEAGNVSQIRACTAKLMETAKTLNIPIIITGHVTKDGSVAGPKTLEHLVDTVIYLEGDKLHGYRLLRSAKNRFGSTDEVGILEMTGSGLTEVKDPTKAFLNNQTNNSGAVISCFMEGSRSFFIEVQALVSPTVFGYPQRKAAGFDLNRLQMIAAVLQKRGKLNLMNQDIHLNIAGGLKVKDTAIDLAVSFAIYSALKDKAIPKNTVIIGELGLGGEIRPVFNLDKRIQEAIKMGFQNLITPKQKLNKTTNINLKQISDINNLLY